MSKLTATQIRSLATNAHVAKKGGSGRSFKGIPSFTVPSDGAAKKGTTIAIAVALAESGGDTEIVSSTNDVGLWQINRAAHSDRISVADSKNPAIATQFAYELSKGWQDFSAWSAFNNGAYTKHLGAAIDAMGGAATVGDSDFPFLPDSLIPDFVEDAYDTTVNAAEQAVDTAQAVAMFMGKLSDPNTWKRVAKIAGGIAMVGGGIYYAFGSSIINVSPVGRVLDAVSKK